MARRYKAFISYRHLPLDTAIAELLHRKIEHYRIPRALRGDDGSRFGYVFRDRDELPLSTSLTGSIQEALDNAEFLIVVCTPETPKSKWVCREIEYFLSHHDMDHVIVVHADGSTAEAFPEALRHSSAVNGMAAPAGFEHLAADLTGRGSRGWRTKARRELLRVFAALLGCDFDDLYRREQRYQARRRSVAAAAVLAVALAFIGLLLNRNARIREQYTLSQRNESQALTALSEAALRRGDRYAAVDYALRALPEDGDRPYLPEAEAALTEALYSYRRDAWGADFAIRQDTEIQALDMSEDARYVATADDYGALRLFSAENGRMLWRTELPDAPGSVDIRFVPGREMLLAESRYGATSDAWLLDLAEGSVLWSGAVKDIAFSDDGAFMAVCALKEDRESGAVLRADIYSTADLSTPLTSVSYASAFLDDLNKLSSALSADGEMFAVTIMTYAHEAETVLFDPAAGEARQLGVLTPAEDELLTETLLRFTPEDELLTVGTCLDAQYITLYGENGGGAWTERFTLRRETAPSIDSTGRVLFLNVRNGILRLGYDQTLAIVNLKTGEQQYELAFPGQMLTGEMSQDGFSFAFDNGGVFSVDSEGYSFRYMDFLLRDAVLRYASDGDMVCAAVPYEYPTTAVLHRSVSGEGVREQWRREDGEYDYLWNYFVSPDGNTIARLETEYDNETEERLLRGVLVEAAGGAYTVTEVSIPLERSVYLSDDNTVLNDDGLLASENMLFDLRAGTGGEFAEMDSLISYDLTTGLVDGHFYSAYLYTGYVPDDPDAGRLLLWTDGEPSELRCPYPGAQYLRYELASTVTIGENGYLVFDLLDAGTETRTGYAALRLADGTWSRVDAGAGTSGERRMCLAAAKPLLAAAEEDGIRIYDLEGGGCVTELAGAPAAGEAAHMMFAGEDEALLVFLGSGMIQIYDAETGGLLAVLDHRDELTFDPDGSYSLRTGPEGELFIQYARSGAYILCVDPALWAETALLEQVRCYIPAADEFYLYSADASVLITCPRYSLAQRMEQGRALLAAAGWEDMG